MAAKEDKDIVEAIAGGLVPEGSAARADALHHRHRDAELVRELMAGMETPRFAL